MTSSSVSTPVVQSQKPWYKEAYVWLVVGGPLAVVLASMVTVYLAVTHPDPVLDRQKPVIREAASAAQEAIAVQRSALPATEARNHAASSELPKDR